ncbi:MAG: thioredoxin domain-containing protein, partial [Chloroflexota bacterium]|nr:thioredoxin domain-containing protein [Chloroflexota bacterium]
MFKKLFLSLIIGVFLLSACSSNTPEPGVTAQPDEPTESIEAPTQEETENVEVIQGEPMPCNTVYDYETTAETDQYQSVVDQQPPVTDEDWIYGNPNAPITIVEYEDFQCPACPGFSL